MTLVFGLTGGIASGKSTVSNLLREQGVGIVDGDVIAREVVEPGSPGLSEVIAAFGPKYLELDGTLARKKLGRLVFANPEKLALFDHILGPYVDARLKKRVEEESLRSGLVCVDSAILIEKGMHERYRPLVVVACSREEQVGRVMVRDGLSKEEAEARVNSQLPLLDKVRVADYVIWNDRPRERLRAEVLSTLCRIQATYQAPGVGGNHANGA